MSGAGVGGGLGGLAGLALAPETGGLSLAIPALAGAGGAFLGGKFTGSKNPLQDALLGGIAGGLGGGLGLGDSLGISNSAGLFGDTAAEGASGATADGLGEGADQLFPSLDPIESEGAASAATDSPASTLGQLGRYAVKNPLQTALAGNIGLSAIQSMLPHPKVNVGQNAANVMATNPGFNATLPKYTMQNTATPYSGNWYTYGETPQTPLYNAQPVLAQAKGGLVPHYAQGGRVRGYAAGGMPMVPPEMPQQPTASQAPSMSQSPINPLAIKTAHNVGLAIGKHLRSKMHTPDGQVRGSGGGQDDAVPARLSQDEFIMPADVVAHLGDGSSNEGGKRMTKMMHNVRKHKATNGAKFPPKAHNPLAYLPKKAKA